MNYDTVMVELLSKCIFLYTFAPAESTNFPTHRSGAERLHMIAAYSRRFSGGWHLFVKVIRLGDAPVILAARALATLADDTSTCARPNFTDWLTAV